MDKYKIIRKLGQGSQSVSYLATPIDNPSQQVVLKRIASNVVRPSDVGVFLRLRHPNIVPCYAALQHEDQLVLVTPYYDGGDLEHYLEHLQKNRSSSSSSSSPTAALVVDPLTVVRWTVQLVRALQHCHEQKVIHRDLKLGSIFVSKDLQRVYLGGFGLARALDKTMSTAATLVGSPVNLSPEVISGQPYSFSSDVWSLGCLVYELLTGNKPFSSASFAQVVFKVCNGQFDPLPSSVPKFLATAVNGMLQVDTKRRWLLAEIVDSDPVLVKADKEMKKQMQQQGASSAGVQQQQQQQQQHQVSTSVSAAANNNRNKVSAAAAGGEEDDDDDGDGDKGDELAASEELVEWVQWKHREFSQIEAALKKIGDPTSTTPVNLLDNDDGDDKKKPEKNREPKYVHDAFADPETPPPPLPPRHPHHQGHGGGVGAASGAAAAAGPMMMDPKRAAQRMLPSGSPRRQSNNQQEIRGGRRAPQQHHPAIGGAVLKPPPPPPVPVAHAPPPPPPPSPPTQPVSSNNNNNPKSNDNVEDAEAKKRREAQEAHAAQSAEKRQAHRVDLQKRIMEGRRAMAQHQQQKGDGGGGGSGASGGVSNSTPIVVATPSRALNMRGGDDITSNNNVHNNNEVAAPPSSSPHPQGKPSPPRSTLAEEIARRRAEQRGTPRSKDGPTVEVVMPSNLRKLIDPKKI